MLSKCRNFVKNMQLLELHDYGDIKKVLKERWSTIKRRMLPWGMPQVIIRFRFVNLNVGDYKYFQLFYIIYIYMSHYSLIFPNLLRWINKKKLAKIQ